MFNEEKVKKLLGNVTYPDFQKDIVTFGFVKKIEIKDDKAVVFIEIPSANPQVAAKIKTDSAEILHKSGIKSEISIFQPKQPETKSNSKTLKNIVPNIKNFVMISSGKGGVGKSTTTVNLALALMEQGKKVGILDADIYGPNIPRMLGAAEQKPEALDGKIKPLKVYGIEMMSIGVLIGEGQSLIWRGAMIMKTIEQLLGDILWSDLDVLFIDMPPGSGDAQLTLAQSVPITCGVCVTTPQTVALDDAKRSLDMFKKLHISVAGIVENMSGFVCSGCGKEYNIFGQKTGEEIAKRYNTAVLAEIPLEPKVREGGDSGKPVVIFHSDTISAKRYKAAALALWQKIESFSGDNSAIQPVSSKAACGTN
ncbi:MAG: Mrp/NBP35 family ATP-binding protein [Campylobacteraceae bacterium]|jgi:ATP-binding protein involved in chromosome partitioning|nr:Mrp/NBP35 family ATP-binding protein [Campylobacteraceae bacterium]